MIKLSVAFLLISSLPFFTTVEASVAIMKQNINRPQKNIITDNNTPTSCKIYAATADLLKLKVVISVYSTYRHESNCPSKENSKLIQSSLEAQLKSIQSISLGVVNGGQFISAVERNLTTAPNPFYYFGTLRYSKIGEVRVNLYDIFLTEGVLPTLNFVANAPYQPRDYYSQTFIVWNPGTLAHMLVSPTGDTYVLTNISNKILGSLNLENASDLKDILRLPTGWDFQSLLLSETIQIRATEVDNYKTVLLTDEFYNVYIKFNK